MRYSVSDFFVQVFGILFGCENKKKGLVNMLLAVVIIDFCIQIRYLHWFFLESLHIITV